MRPLPILIEKVVAFGHSTDFKTQLAPSFEITLFLEHLGIAKHDHKPLIMLSFKQLFEKRNIKIGNS